MSTEGLTTEKRVLVAISAISSFILGMILSQWIFSYFQIESVTSGVMSVVSGTIIAWIVLMLSGILKEFTIKGAGFELSSKLKELKDEVKTSNTEICEKINNLNQNFLSSVQSLNNRIDTVVTNISSSSATSENNFHLYTQSKEELNSRLSQTGIPSKITSDKVISRSEIEKIDLLMNKVDTLEKTLNRKVTLTPPEILSRANYYYFKNQFDDAIKLYNDLLNEDKDNYEALSNMAHCYFKIGDGLLSLKYYKDANKIRDDFTSLYNVGVSYMSLLDFKNAKIYLNKALEKNPNHLNSILSLADIARDENNFSLAKEKYEYVLKLNPNYIMALDKLMTLYQHNDDIQNARKYAEKIINTPPKNTLERTSRGIAYVVLDNLSQALEIFNEILIKDPNQPAALYNKACVMSLRGKLDESLALLRRCIKLDSSFTLSLDKDPDLENVRKDPRFQELTKS